MPSSGGDPQRYRNVLRELKRGKGPDDLLKAARSIRDPYYRSLSMAGIGILSRLDPDLSDQVLAEALKEASSVPSEWRKGELLGELIHMASKAPDKDKGALIERGSMNILKAMPPGHGRSEGIRACAKGADATISLELLALSLMNKGFELENGKAVLKGIFRDKGPSKDEVEGLLLSIDGSPTPILATLLLSYLSHRLDRSSRTEEASKAFGAAMGQMACLEGPELLQAFNDLARKAPSKERLSLLRERAIAEKDPFNSVKMLSVTSDALDRLGDREGAISLLMMGMERAGPIPEGRKAEVLASCSNAFRRLGDTRRAEELSARALELSGEDDPTSHKVRRVLGMVDGKASEAPPGTIRAPAAAGTHVLALFDTYEGRLGPVHFRALARAAPLCWAFSLDLALIGFPTNDLDRLVDLSTKETSVGEEGRYIRMLAEQGRIKLVPCGKDPHPSVWNGLGMPVATTPHPDNAKSLDMPRAIGAARSRPSGKVCLIMGLGKRGLPPSLLRSVPHHLELTGSNISLETATAMGIMAYMLHSSSAGQK